MGWKLNGLERLEIKVILFYAKFHNANKIILAPADSCRFNKRLTLKLMKCIKLAPSSVLERHYIALYGIFTCNVLRRHLEDGGRSHGQMHWVFNLAQHHTKTTEKCKNRLKIWVRILLLQSVSRPPLV